MYDGVNWLDFKEENYISYSGIGISYNIRNV